MWRMRFQSRDTRIAVLLFLALSIFYYQSAPRDLSDFRYMTLVARGLFWHGDITLDAWAPPPHGAPDAVPVSDVLPYQFTVHGEHVYHRFPPGSAVLMAPVVGLAEALGYSILDETGGYDRAREARVLHYFAAVSTALLVALFYVQAILYLDRRMALLIALGAGLGTPLWSVNAGTLWSHNFCALGLCAALLLLTRAEKRGLPPSGLLLGSLLAWMFFVRPTSALSIAVLLPYAIWRWRSAAAPTVVTSAAWLGLFVVYSDLVWGEPLPPYYRTQRLLGFPPAEALLGTLVSPARGLLVYVPAVVWLAALVTSQSRRLPHRSLAMLGSAVCVMHWWMVSSFPHWWGGHSWGPRLMTDLVPWWVLLIVLGTAALRKRPESEPVPALLRPAAATALVAFGVLMNVVGVGIAESMRWNREIDIDAHPERLWDWRHPPFLHWRQDPAP